MNAAAPDLSAAHAALHREREVRERYRGTFPDDPERRQAYEDVADKLSKAAQPLSPYVRRGPQIGRAVSDDPVRVTRKNLHAASKRVRAVLNRTSGTPTPKVPRPTSRAIWGHLSQLRQELYDIELEHEGAEKGAGLRRAHIRPDRGLAAIHERAERRGGRNPRTPQPRTPAPPYAARPL